VLLFPLVACAPPPEPELTDADKAAIVDELDALTQELNALGTANDQEAMNAYYVTDPTAYFVGEPAMYLHGMRLLPDNEAIREQFAPMAESRQGTTFEPQKEYTAVLSPTLAIRVAEVHWFITNNDGEVGDTFPLASTTVWVKEGEAWKILHYHHTWSNTPVEGTGS
jgi:ketosteroid isomerase-like protein